MTKKDFELIASVIWNLDLDSPSIRTVAKAFADALQKTNPRFNRDKFLKACGIRSSTAMIASTSPSQDSRIYRLSTRMRAWIAGFSGFPHE